MRRLALAVWTAVAAFWPAAVFGDVSGRATGWWTDRQGHNHYGPAPEPDASGAWQAWSRSSREPARPSLSPAALAFNDGNALWRAGRYAEAAGRYERAVGLDPADVDAWSNLAACYYMLGRHDQARQAYERALKINPRHELAIKGLAVLKSYLAQVEEYERRQAAIRLAKDAWDGARAAFDNKDYARAAAGFRRCAELNPSDPAVFINLAVCLDLTGDLTATLAAYEEALRRFPNAARARELYAKSLALNSPLLARASDPIRLRQAEGLFRRGMELGFTNINYRDLLLGNLERQRNVSVALGDLAWTEEAAKKLVEAAPRQPLYRSFLGEALIAKGDLAGGKAVFAQAGRDFPAVAAVPLWLSKALIGARDYEGALEALTDALRMTPEDQAGERAAAHVLMGRCRQMKGDRAGVAEEADKALSSAPEDPFVRAMTACLLRDGGFGDKAMEVFGQTLQMLPAEAFEKSLPEDGWQRALQEAALGEKLVEAIRARDVLVREFLPRQWEDMRSGVERGDWVAAVRGFEAVRKLERDAEKVRAMESEVRRLERAEVGKRLDRLAAGMRGGAGSPADAAGTGRAAPGAMDEAIAARIHGAMARLGSFEAAKDQAGMVFDTPSRLRGPLAPGVYVPEAGPSGAVGVKEPAVPEKLRTPRITQLETRREAAKRKRAELETKVKEMKAKPAETPAGQAEMRAAASQLEQARAVEQTCNVLIEQELIDAMAKEEMAGPGGAGAGEGRP